MVRPVRDALLALIWWSGFISYFIAGQLFLPQHGSQSVLQVGNQLLHHFVNLLVVQCGILVLQQETYGIRFLAGFQVLAFIDVEEETSFSSFFSVS